MEPAVEETEHLLSGRLENHRRFGELCVVALLGVYLASNLLYSKLISGPGSWIVSGLREFNAFCEDLEMCISEL